MSKIKNPQRFEIVGLLKNNNKTNAPCVNGELKYARILIKPTIKEEDRNFEVYDEDEDIIYRVPEYMIPQIIEEIEYRRMVKDWVKTNKFNGEEEEYLRFLGLALNLQGLRENDENAIQISETIHNQRFEKLQPKAYTFQELKDMAEPILMEKYKVFFENKYRWLCKLRGEDLPNFIN